MFPKLVINKKNISHNVKKILEKCNDRNLDLVAVTKLCSGNEDIVELFVDLGVKTIGDSRILNLKKFKDIKVKKMQLRLPMVSEIEDTVKYSDVCLVSEIKTIELLNNEAKNQNKIYEIILMIETGDIREGIQGYEIISNTLSKIKTMSNILLTGIGTNFACFGGTIPTVDKLNELVDLKDKINMDFNIKIKLISAGNSSHISIWDEPSLKSDINQIRSGAALFMGIGLNDEPITFLKQDTLKLHVQVIENQIKPTQSWGPKGLNAFGEAKVFENKGDKRKMIVALGKQDVDYLNIVPLDEKLKIIGQSSDHTIIECDKHYSKYEIGSIIELSINYSAAIELFTSQFVEKVLI